MIKKIFHTADWHLRNNERHDEFKEAISLLGQSIKEQKMDYDDALICIAGDLFETREGISNEAFYIMSEALDYLSEIHRLVIILGNHDIPYNLQRMDAITPLIKAMKNNNIIFSKQSEIFKVENIIFAHYCFLDNFAVQCPKTKDTDYKYIGLYHHPIKNCKQPLNPQFENKMKEFNVSADFFTNCDVVLMGDIHYAQTISAPKYKAYYSGSLYQQNIGEFVNGHGYGILDIGTLDYQFVELEHSFGQYKISINSIDDLTNNQEKITNLEVKI